MKRFLVLFVAIAFFGGIALVGCGPKEEAPKPPESTEQATPAPAPAPEKAPEAAPAPAPEKAPEQPK